ncbi:MAG: hypothetical protein D6824_02355, partial [Planctomycetota bacterium]
QTSDQMRAARFVDVNNTGYYADPASTSYFNDFRTNVLYDRQNTTYYWDGTNTGISMRVGDDVSIGYRATNTDDYLYFDRQAEYLFWDDSPGQFQFSDDLVVNGNLTVTGSVNGGGSNNFIKNQNSSYQAANFWISGQGRVGILYDSNNTGFYADPASTSYFNDFRASIMYDRDNTSYYANPASTSIFNDFRASIVYDRNNTSYYVNPAGNNHMRYSLYLDDSSVTSHTIIGRGDQWVSGAGKGVIQYYSSYIWPGRVDGTSGGGWNVSWYLASHASYGLYTNTGFYHAGNIWAPRMYDSNSTAYYADPASTSYFNDFRPNIIYDRNNTTYYVDPASTTKLNALVVNSCSGCVGSGNGSYIQN